MNLTPELTDEAVRKELGARVKRARLRQNRTQQDVADEASIGRPALVRFEGGHDVTFTTVIRTLRTLGMIDRLDALAPDESISPVEIARHTQHPERQRARPTEPKPSTDKGTIWGDER